MRGVIGGRLYDTEKSQHIATALHNSVFGILESHEELYKSPNLGHLFIASYGEFIGPSMALVTDEGALEWLEKNAITDPEAYRALGIEIKDA